MILYHHEHADGTGPFQKKWNEIPLFARIIHLADTIDIIGNNTGSGNNSWNFICQYLLKNRDGLFDSECVNAFFMHSHILNHLYVYVIILLKRSYGRLSQDKNRFLIGKRVKMSQIFLQRL